MKITRLIFVWSLAAIVFAAPVRAQELADVEGYRLDLRSNGQRTPFWITSAESSWGGRSTIRETGGNVTMGQMRVGLSTSIPTSSDFRFSAGVHYSLREIDAPPSAALPDSLHSVGISLGVSHPVNDDLTLGVTVSPTLSSDFESVSTSDVRVPVFLRARYKASPKLTLNGGIAYTGLNHSFPVLPFVGFIYRPSEQWSFGIGFPRTGVTYRPNQKTELFLAAQFSAGEYHLHDPSIGAEAISFRERRIAAGAAFRLMRQLKLEVSGGYAFGRKFVFYEGNRSDLNLDNAPFASVALRAGW